MDSLYVIQGGHFIIQGKEDTRGLYRVYLRKDATVHELTPRSVRDQFADKYNQLVADLELPECL